MVYRLLKRQGWRKLVPRPFHVDADKEKQEAFKKNSLKLLLKNCRDRDPEDNRPVLLFAQDEGRFGRISDVRRAWSPLGPDRKRPGRSLELISMFLQQFALLLGRMTSLILPWANTEMMNIFLSQVAEDFSDYFILMLADQAGWHVSQGFKST